METWGSLTRRNGSGARSWPRCRVYRAGWRGLGETLLRQGRFEAGGNALAKELIDKSLYRQEGPFLNSRISLELGAVHEARRWLDQALSQCPDDPEVIRFSCSALRARTARGGQYLRRLVERFPDDASARHNWGHCCFGPGGYDEAAGSYREGAAIPARRPGHTCAPGLCAQGSGPYARGGAGLATSAPARARRPGGGQRATARAGDGCVRRGHFDETKGKIKQRRDGQASEPAGGTANSRRLAGIPVES